MNIYIYNVFAIIAWIFSVISLPTIIVSIVTYARTGALKSTPTVENHTRLRSSKKAVTVLFVLTCVAFVLIFVPLGMEQGFRNIGIMSLRDVTPTDSCLLAVLTAFVMGIVAMAVSGSTLKRIQPTNANVMPQPQIQNNAPAQQFCTGCGNPVEPGTAFCPSCGKQQ